MKEHPFDRIVQTLRARGSRVAPKRDSHGRDSVRTSCPTHPDRNPSLVITREGATVLLKCFGGCPIKNVITALNLTLADLFSAPRQATGPKRIVAFYDYADPLGVLVAQKVRFEGKTFAWRIPSVASPGKWRWGLHGASVGLYRWPDLIDTVTIFQTEGEKAADRLWSLGIPATCGPGGAGHWTAQWSEDLHAVGCRELIIVPDNDQAGARHAELVAGLTSGRAVDESIGVKVVALPNLAPKADIVDWLDAGNDGEDLFAIVAGTPLWRPGQTERDRADRKRQLNLVRQHRCRAKRRLSRAVSQSAYSETEMEAVTHRMSGPRPVTHRMPVPEAVTRHAVTLPNVLLTTLQGSDLDLDRSAWSLAASVDGSGALPEWVTALDEPLFFDDSDWPFALRDES